MSVLIALGMGGFLVLMLVIGLGVWKLNQNLNKKEDLSLLFERDKEDRYRSEESLRSELRENAKELREQFDRVNKTVDTKLSESSRQLNDRINKSSEVMGNLQKELGKMGAIGSQIESLNKIMRAPKGRGSMGEASLEEILRSVFPPNLWERQFTLGKGLQVDAVVKTVNGLIPIDAKFPMTGFETFINASSEEERKQAKKIFVDDIKKRINEVAKYVQPQAGTLNFALLFLGSENIYYEAAIANYEIQDHAREKKVLLTGPNTMLYVLQLLFQAYQSQEFAKKAQQALSQLSGIQNQALKLEEGISVLEKHISNAHGKVADVRNDNQKLQQNVHEIAHLQSPDLVSLPLNEDDNA